MRQNPDRAKKTFVTATRRIRQKGPHLMTEPAPVMD